MYIARINHDDCTYYVLGKYETFRGALRACWKYDGGVNDWEIRNEDGWHVDSGKADMQFNNKHWNKKVA